MEPGISQSVVFRSGIRSDNTDEPGWGQVPWTLGIHRQGPIHGLYCPKPSQAAGFIAGIPKVQGG